MAGHEWIRRFVCADHRAVGKLRHHLSRGGKKPNWKGGRQGECRQIPGQSDIYERPAEVNTTVGGAIEGYWCIWSNASRN